MPRAKRPSLPKQRSKRSLTQSESNGTTDSAEYTDSLETEEIEEIEEVIEERDEEDEESSVTSSSKQSKDSDAERSSFRQKIQDHIVKRSTSQIPEEYHHLFGIDDDDEKADFKANKQKNGRTIIRTTSLVRVPKEKSNTRRTQSSFHLRE